MQVMRASERIGGGRAGGGRRRREGKCARAKKENEAKEGMEEGWHVCKVQT